MATLAGRGELVAHGRPTVVPGRPGHVRIELVTTAQVPQAGRGVRARLLRSARWGRPRTLTVVIVSTAAAVLTAAIWLVASLVAWVAAHFALIVGAALVAVVVAMLVGNSRGGPGCRCC